MGLAVDTPDMQDRVYLNRYLESQLLSLRPSHTFIAERGLESMKVIINSQPINKAYPGALRILPRDLSKRRREKAPRKS